MVPRVALTLLCFLLTMISVAEERTITLVGDEWCPFNCADHPDHRGFLVERTAAALAEKGIKLEYIEMPWSRAIIGVRKGRYDAIVGTGPTETPDFIFPPEPLAYARHSFYALASSVWEYQGLESLKEVRIGVIQDYSYGGLFKDYIRPNQDDESRVLILGGNKVLPRLVKLLELGRIDVIVAEKLVLDYYFKSRGVENPLRYAGLANEEALYVAFSPVLDDGVELAKSLGSGLRRWASDVKHH